MAISWVDLVEPKGPINPDMFPDDVRGLPVVSGTLEHRLSAYVAEGVVKVTAFVAAYPSTTISLDRAILVWGLHRAFLARYFSLSNAPAQADLTDKGGRTYLQSQIDAFWRLAEQYRREYERLTVVIDASQGTVAVRNSFRLF